MPKYLIQADFTLDGVKGTLKEGGTRRRAAVQAACRSVGGKLEAFYYAFGETDAFVIADVPDSVSAAALSMAVSAGGAVTTKTTVLITPEEMDQVAKKQPAYRPPGASRRRAAG